MTQNKDTPRIVYNSEPFETIEIFLFIIIIII